MSQKTVTVSVRRLVEFILRSGDIDTVSGAFGEMDAMQQGGLMHRKLQKEASYFLQGRGVSEAYDRNG